MFNDNGKFNLVNDKRELVYDKWYDKEEILYRNNFKGILSNHLVKLWDNTKNIFTIIDSRGYSLPGYHFKEIKFVAEDLAELMTDKNEIIKFDLNN